MSMKLYTSVGPNPKVVRMFMAERGVTAETIKVDLRGGENRREPYLAKNPSGQLPCLELASGTVLAEIIPICEYLDEIAPGPSLIGANALECAVTRMWIRRIDLNIVDPLTKGFQYAEGLPIFQERIRTIPDAAPALKQIAAEKLAWLDGLIEGQDFICHNRLTLADILLWAFLDFGNKVGQPFDRNLSTIPAWFDRIAARSSAT